MGESYSGIRAIVDFICDIAKYQHPSPIFSLGNRNRRPLPTSPSNGYRWRAPHTTHHQYFSLGKCNRRPLPSPQPHARSNSAGPFAFRRPYKYCLPASSSSPLATVALARLRSHNCSRARSRRRTPRCRVALPPTPSAAAAAAASFKRRTRRPRHRLPPPPPLVVVAFVLRHLPRQPLVVAPSKLNRLKCTNHHLNT